MTSLLFIAVLVMAALLKDTRRRMHRMEGLVRELELLFENWARQQASRSARSGGEAEGEPAPAPFQAAPFHAGPGPVSKAAALGRRIAAIRDRMTDVPPFLGEPLPAGSEKPSVEAAAAAPAAAPIDVPAPASASASDGGFEDLFGRKLPIWAGGVTLAVAGILLVKYSIDAGLLSPAIRVLLGLLFGAGLIGGAEFALRQKERVRDDRVHQALSGAGIASLYAAIVAAANLYQLIGPGLAFVGLVAVTALALGLSLRFGAPSALLGLAGGLAAPALVQAQEPNVPLLCTYLALAMGGLGALSRRQRWLWLGLGALVGGAGWGLILILRGGLDFASTLSVGALVLIAGVALPALAFPRTSKAALRGGGALAAAAQIALLVATGGFGPLQWGLYGLLSAAILWLTHREDDLRLLPAAGLATGLLLAAIWPAPALPLFVAVMIGMAMLYGGFALWRLWRPEGSLLEAGQIIAIALGGFCIAWLHFHEDAAQDMAFVLLALAAALLPAGAALLGWNRAERQEDRRFAALATAAALLVALAGMTGLPEWMVPPMLALLAAGLLGLSFLAVDHRVERPAQAFLLAAAVAVPLTQDGPAQIYRLFSEIAQPALALALIRWLALALVAVLFAGRVRDLRQRPGFQLAATFLAYGAVAQIVPAPWLALAAAAGLVALAEVNRRGTGASLLPAMAGCAALAAFWAIEPMSRWASAALLSTGGVPLYVSDLPAPLLAAQRLLLPALLLLAALWRNAPLLARREVKAAGVAAAAVALAGLHIGYKQLFAIADDAAFVQHGLAERTLWEALLLSLGFALWRWGRQATSALIATAAAIAHGLLYTVILHDPLWQAQAVGPVPFANWLLPAFGLPLAGLWLVERIAPGHAARFARPFDLGRMAAITLFAFASLRQLFGGSLFHEVPVGSVENIGWSVLAIALAIGFLLWGIRRRARDWRIASLMMMLAAVAKVFLLDASGLQGLLRIASFLALGFSLIGIGWLYSRYWQEGEEPALPQG